MSFRLLIGWGVIAGLIAACVEWFVFWITDVGTLVLPIVTGIVLTTLLFIPSRQSHGFLRASTFCAITTLTPLISVILGNSPYYGRLVLSLDPIAIMAAVVWAAVLLPFGLLSAIVDNRLSHG